MQALNCLEQGEEWLVPPRFLDKKHYILAPAIKWGVNPKNFSFQTELFGPMLSVACFDTFEEAIGLVNGLEYGLTSGLQSLDENEQKLWKEKLEAGNLYINRGITGAIVNRQPFGGMKNSAFGGGIKAGGPNYCSIFVNIEDKPESKTDYRRSYALAYQDEFSNARDVNHLYGEQNVFRYIPLKTMALRVFPEDSKEHIEMIVSAAQICGVKLVISFDPADDRTSDLSATGCELRKEPLNEFIGRLHTYNRIRTCSSNIPVSIYKATSLNNIHVVTEPPVKNGRVELIHYFKEQSISFEYHRYGSILEQPSIG